MGLFRSEQEVYDTLGKLFLDMLQDGDLMADFRASDTIVQYRLQEPEARITVNLKRDQEPAVDLGTTQLEPEVTMSMAVDTAHRFWLGKVNLTVALARGQIKAKGPVAKMLKLVPLAKPVFPRYEAQLRQQGRLDLVELG
jgi:putative sterol carrier protein